MIRRFYRRYGFTIVNMQKGFTLFESVLYIGIISMVLFAFIQFTLAISSVREKHAVVAQIHGETRHVMDVLRSRVQGAMGINVASSTFESDPGVLSLSMASSTLNPTVFSLSADNGRLQMTEGGGGVIYVTGSDVRVTDFTLYNATSGSVRENVRVDITIENANSVGDPRLDFTQSIHSNISVRQ